MTTNLDLARERLAMVAQQGNGPRMYGVRNRQRAELLLTELLTTAQQLGVDPAWLVWNSELARICLSATKRFASAPVDESVSMAQMLDRPEATVAPSARYDR
jgi:hypothetical protein